jgi:hypothetical protein
LLTSCAVAALTTAGSPGSGFPARMAPERIACWIDSCSNALVTALDASASPAVAWVRCWRRIARSSTSIVPMTLV